MHEPGPASLAASARWAGRLPLVAGFLVLYLFWGSTYLVLRLAVETLPPFLLMGTRSLVAGGLLTLWARRRGGPVLRAAHWREALLQGAFLFAGCHGALAWAETRVSSGEAALLLATMPGWMALGEWLGPRRVRPGWHTASGVLLGVAGIAVLTRPGTLSGGGDGELDALRVAAHPAAAAALLGASLSWVVGSLRARYAPLPGSALQRAGANLLAGGGMLVLIALVRGEHLAPEALGARSLLALGYLIAFGTMLCLCTYLWLLQRVRPTLVASYAFVNPLVAVVLGAAVGGEPLDARIRIATALLVASVAILLMAPNPGDRTRRRTET